MKKIFIVRICTLILLFVLISGCFQKVAIKDAYCDLNGHFKFTIQNPEDEEISLDYKWTLNDPMADEPIHKGEGLVTLQGLEEKNISVSIPTGLHNYDARSYVMYIYLYLDGKQICKYREQKSPYDWDYSFLPPVKFKEKPEQVYIAFETFVSKNEQNDFIVQIKNMSYNSYKSQINLKLSEFYITVGDKNGEEWLTSEILSTSTQGQPQFYDVDSNNIISNFDYYIIPSNLSNNLETSLIEFDTACPFVYKGWDWRGELLQEEDRNAIIIKDISTNPENATTLEGLEFIIEIQSKYGINFAAIDIVNCDGRGKESTGIHLHRVSQNEQNYTYSGKFEDVLLEDKTGLKHIYIELKDNDVNERLVLYELEL